MNNVTDQTNHAHKLLNMILGATTTLFLLLTLYFIWENEQKQMAYQTEMATHQISNTIDGLIDEVTQAVYAANIKSANASDCKQTTLPALEHIVLNTPMISGLAVINEKKQVVCSTLPKNDRSPTIPTDSRPLTLFGPVMLSNIKKPVFIIQQQLGQDSIDIYLLKENLEKLLKYKLPNVKTIALYDQTRKKMLLEITQEPPPKSTWIQSSPTEIKNSLEMINRSDKTLFRNELIRLNHVEVVVETDELRNIYLALRYIIMAGTIILLVSYGIYYYLSHLIRQHFSLHRAIQIGIKNNDFFPVYQPIMNAQLNNCCGAEVLIRWRTQNNEIIMPDNFIEYAEQSGLIVPITLQLSKKVFLECGSLLRHDADFHLAINLSSAHFVHPNFLDAFIDLCKVHHISHKQITFEVTERDLLENDSELVAKMLALRETGFSLSIDDFGTGHSSISYLHQFPFNFLKIDRLFVNAIGTGAITESLNQSIIDMANHLKLSVIAEGVETHVQVESLKSSGVYLMQGWHFSRALPYHDLYAFIKRSCA